MHFPMRLAQTTAESDAEAAGFRFQPIIRLADMAAAGHELLAGFERCPERTPTQWREWYDRVPALVQQHAPAGMVFVNVDSDQIADDPAILAALTRTRRILRDHLVVEWTEHGWLDNGRTSILALKALGFRIAVDDVGDGADGLGRVSAVRPEFAKISHALFHRMRSTGAESLLHLRHLLEKMGCHVILEGIETANDLALAKQAGFTLGQGWLFPSLSWLGG